MANTKKKVVDGESAIITDAERENIELRTRLANMEEQIAKLMEMKIPAEQSPVKKKRKIVFYNMLPHEIIFNGTKTHRLKNQFDSAAFNENEAVAIVNNMYNTIRMGYLYIADSKFVEENDLDTIYEGLLSNEQLRDLLNKDANYVVDIYKSVEESQKKIIVDMLANKKLKGEQIDANILMQIGNLSGKDLLGIKPFED